MVELEIISPKKVHFKGTVNQVMLPGTDGDFSVFPGHAPVLSSLRYGALVVVEDEIETYYVIAEGLCGVRNNLVTVLVEQCTPLTEFELESVETKLKDVDDKLGSAKTEDAKRTLKHEREWLLAVQTSFKYKELGF